MACVRKINRKNGHRYMLDFYDHMGIRKREVLPQGTTKKAADKRMREILDLLHQGVYTSVSNIPRFSDIAKAWLDLKRANVRPSTWGMYGKNVKYIQTQLGHSSPTVTMNIYAHLLTDRNQAAARRLEEAILK